MATLRRPGGPPSRFQPDSGASSRITASSAASGSSAAPRLSFSARARAWAVRRIWAGLSGSPDSTWPNTCVGDYSTAAARVTKHNVPGRVAPPHVQEHVLVEVRPAVGWGLRADGRI